MEVDLIRFHRKYKTDPKATNNLVYTKISRKFESKGYPRISLKSIKYKYEKLLTEPEKLRDLEEMASGQSAVESEDDVYMNTTRNETKPQVKKTFSSWNEEMDVMLLHLAIKIKKQFPAESENSLYRKLTREMQFEGFNNITENIIYYHYKKLKQDDLKFDRLMAKVEKLKQDESMSSDSDVNWSPSAEAAMMNYRDRLKEQQPSLRPAEIWFNVKEQLELLGHGSFSVYNIKKRYFDLMHSKDKSQELLDESACHSSSETSKSKKVDKRNYMYWTEEMKQALMTHRKNIVKQVGPGEIWECVAKQMTADGFGVFTAANVRYKYFNLKRSKGGKK